ncbi:MAG: RNase adapter RapZ [Alphaproteobacteria bacterium]
MTDPAERTRIVLVSGLSGAGKSSTLKCLEDLGYEAIDNVPLSLLPNLLQASPEHPREGSFSGIAIGVDSRTRAFNTDQLIDLFDALEARDDLSARLVFLTASDSVLIRRFTETRRRHPLAVDRPVQDGIASERTLMTPLRLRAENLIDTTDLTGHELRRVLTKQFALEKNPNLAITVMSFSYARGLPRDADLVLDVRFLRNPHYLEELRPQTGQDAAVAAYVEADTEFEAFWQSTNALILPLLPAYQREGKSYLTVAFGCTGGKHRSVVLAEKFSSLLRASGFGVTTVHRDIETRTQG